MLDPLVPGFAQGFAGRGKPAMPAIAKGDGWEENESIKFLNLLKKSPLALYQRAFFII